MRARRRGWAAVLLAVIGGVAGAGPVLLATAGPAWAFQAEAQMIETDPKVYDFNPPVIEIYVGDRVRWRNDTPVKHTVTSDPGSPVAFDSDEVPPPPPDSSQQAKNEYTKRFTEPGRYDYRCKIHANMRGVVQVSDPRVTSTTATTAPPPTTTTTARPTTTTTAPPPTTTTTAPTTTTTLRPPAGVEPPPVPATAAAPPPTRATTSTTVLPTSTTTTTAPPPTTAPSVPPPTSPEPAVPAPPTSSPPATDPPQTPDTAGEDSTAAAPISGDGDTDPATVALVAALVAVGLFGAWTLIRVRPGRV